MQNWDRMAMIGVGALISLFTARDGWRLWQKANYLGAAGVVLLILAAIGVPLALAFLAT